jgi:hypothetical protein
MTKDAKQVHGVLKDLILEARILSGQRVFRKSAHESINEKPRWTTSGVCSNPSRKMAPWGGFEPPADGMTSTLVPVS